MNSEQLHAARLARWSQDGEARLTLEEITEWFNSVGLCLYLPVRGVAAPSFVEAVVGRPAPGPSAKERARAKGLLTRLVEKDLAVPLKFKAAVSEDADWIVTPDVFRYVYALLGNRNFKGEPPVTGQDAVTPLALHCWQALQQYGALDIAGLQEHLGRETSDSAIARALHELWAALYVFPLSGMPDAAAQWDLLYRRWSKPVAAGTSTGHAEAQSALISLVLQFAVAAPEEELLAILSPLAPLSKLREVVRGLGAMRQLDMIDVDGHPHLCLQGSVLPQSRFVSPPVPRAAAPELTAAAETATQPGIEIESVATPRPLPTIRKFTPQRPSGAPPRRRFDSEKPDREGRKPFGDRKQSGERKPYGDRGERSGGPRKFGQQRPDFRRAQSDDRSSPGSREFRPAKRWEKSGEHREAREPREGGFRKPGKSFDRPRTEGNFPGKKFEGRKFSDRKPFERKPFDRKPRGEEASGESGSSRPFRPKNAGKFSRPASGPRKPWGERSGSGGGFERRPRRDDGDARPARRSHRDADSADGGDRPRKVSGGKPFGKKFGGPKSSGSRPGGAKPFRPKNSGGKKPFSGGRSAGPGRPRKDKGGKRP